MARRAGLHAAAERAPGAGCRLPQVAGTGVQLRLLLGATFVGQQAQHAVSVRGPAMPCTGLEQRKKEGRQGQPPLLRCRALYIAPVPGHMATSLPS